MNKKINIIFGIIAVVAVALTIVIFTGKPDKKGPEEVTTEKAGILNGFYKVNGEWLYYKNGERAQETEVVHGTVNDIEGLWMTVDGKVDFTLTSLEKKENSWQYVKNGEVREKTDAEAFIRWYN